MKSRYKSAEGRRLIHETYDRLVSAWNVETEEKDIATKYGATHVITAGNASNPPLLLLHGVGDDSALMWIYNAKELARHFRLYAVDTMGGPGKSEPNENYFKTFDQAGWLDEVVDTLEISGTDIAGVSNGAAMAMNYTVKHPDKVGRVIFMAAGGYAGMGKMLKFLPAVLFPSEKTARKLMSTMGGQNVSMFLNNADIMEHWGYLLKHFRTTSMMYHKPARFEDSELIVLKDISLFLLGEEDGLADLPKAEQWYKTNKFYYKVVKNAGHGINHQQPELINKEIVDYLSTTAVGSSGCC